MSTDKLVCLTSQSIEIYEKDFPFEIKVQKISDREKEYISLLETSKKLLISSSSNGSLRLYNQEDLSIKKEFSCSTSFLFALEIEACETELFANLYRINLSSTG